MSTTNDNVYHADALIRKDWHCPNLNTLLGSEHSIIQNQLNLQRRLWILGAKEPPLQLQSSLYGTHTFDVTSTIHSSFCSLFLQSIKPGFCTTLPTVPVSCCWFQLLWTAYEAPGWQAICNRSWHEPHSYRHLAPISSTPAHTLASWSDKGLNISSDYMEYMEVWCTSSATNVPCTQCSHNKDLNFTQFVTLFFQTSLYKSWGSH
jgi:hypothetical protein